MPARLLLWLHVCEPVWFSDNTSISCPIDFIFMCCIIFWIYVYYSFFPTLSCLIMVLFYVCLFLATLASFCSSYWSHVLLVVITHSVVYNAGLLLILFSISASGSVVLSDIFLDWYCRYVSAVTVVGFMCCLFLEMHLPLFVSWITYDLLWWLWLPLPTTVCHPHAELLQLTLWEYLKILVIYCCHSFFVSLLAWCDGGHHGLVL